MGVVNYEYEQASTLPPAKLFKASILDSDNLIPKVIPGAFKSFEILHGDGGAGSIKLITFGDSNITIFSNIDYKWFRLEISF